MLFGKFILTDTNSLQPTKTWSPELCQQNAVTSSTFEIPSISDDANALLTQYKNKKTWLHYTPGREMLLIQML